jgi:hypothetical protein
MALLLDLPPARRAELARTWGTEESTALLYRAMTDRAALRARVAELSPGARQALATLRREPASRVELLARLPLGEERLAASVEELAGLGLVLRLPERGVGPPRLAIGAGPGEALYVAADVADALGRTGG